jgi:hypothetical protein
MSRLSALFAGYPLLPGRFLILRAILRRVRSIKKANYLIGNRTRNLPASGIVPENYTTAYPIVKLIVTIVGLGSNGIDMDGVLENPELKFMNFFHTFEFCFRPLGIRYWKRLNSCCISQVEIVGR